MGLYVCEEFRASAKIIKESALSVGAVPRYTADVFTAAIAGKSNYSRSITI